MTWRCFSCSSRAFWRRDIDSWKNHAHKRLESEPRVLPQPSTHKAQSKQGDADAEQDMQSGISPITQISQIFQTHLYTAIVGLRTSAPLVNSQAHVMHFVFDFGKSSQQHTDDVRDAGANAANNTRMTYEMQALRAIAVILDHAIVPLDPDILAVSCARPPVISAAILKRPAHDGHFTLHSRTLPPNRVPTLAAKLNAV